MKTPTHIYIFEEGLSAEQFELANKRTKNHDFEKLKIEDYPTLFSILEIMCDEYWGGEFENVYATYLVNDFTTLKLSNLEPSHILEYNDKLKSVFEEAHTLYTFNDKLVDGVSNATGIIDEYYDIKIENLNYKREVDTEYFSTIYEVISEEKENLIRALDEQLNELNLATLYSE
jgi:hypothetical protein